MHIEPGFVSAAKVAVANVTACGLAASQLKTVWKQPLVLAKALAAAVFFSLFMEVVHQPVGPSELHFIGATAVYFLFGFTPTLLGFGLGLALQGLFFAPADLYHLGVNALSLMIPLGVMHARFGARFFEGADKPVLRVSEILKADAMFYSGVVLMVGFWLSLGEAATPFGSWLTWAASYLPMALVEPLVTWSLLAAARRVVPMSLARDLTELPRLRFE